MLKENKVKITICGKEYSLQTDERPAYVQQLAGRLDHKITEMMENNDTLSLSSAAILVGDVYKRQPSGSIPGLLPMKAVRFWCSAAV